MRETRDDPELASPAEFARVVGRLAASDRRRLELIARARAGGLAATDWRDLLQESVARTLEGSRRWPRTVPIIAFLAQTMRSIASEQRQRGSECEVDAEAVAAAPQEDPHRIAEASDQLRHIQARFAGDDKVRAFIEGLQKGETARETQGRTGMTATEYDAARKRFWRGVAELSGDGM